MCIRDRSERRAIELADPARPVLLLSIRGNNAYASATEVMAWMVSHNRIAVLSDATDAAESGLLERWGRTAGAWEKLKGTRAGLIGTVSEWLVASDVTAETLHERFGVELTGIPWRELPDYSNQEPDTGLLDRFRIQKPEGIGDAARVLTLLRRVISENRLDAIGVECFSLVQQRKVTACLALAQLNTEGTVAACEGDLASMAGMMAGKALTGKVPWMANTTRLTDNTLILSHCTAPFDFVSDVELPSHYETGWSLAVEGTIKAKEVTLFRFSDTLDRAVIAEGRVISRPHLADACRTQVEIALPVESIRTLKERPLGNHLLMLEGNHSEILELAFRYRNIEIVR
jgi:L-fucose isomerase-like protein